jgi:serine protease SohB
MQAASGGYMMACVADKIICSPFAIIGSVGVVSEFLNFYDILKGLGINYHQYTAGKYKRTISILGRITDEGESKFKEDLNDMYLLFKEHVARHRKNLDIEKIATGEHWSGINALGINLVDEILTSEEYIINSIKNNKEVLKITYIGNRKSFTQQLTDSFVRAVFDGAFDFFARLSVTSKYWM